MRLLLYGIRCGIIRGKTSLMNSGLQCTVEPLLPAIFYNVILFTVPADIPSPSCFDLSMKASTRFAPPRWLWLRGQLDCISCLGIDAIGDHN